MKDFRLVKCETSEALSFILLVNPCSLRSLRWCWFNL